ncbi:hypothetical protein NK718_21470 [Alsobacter sp. SYSU M60028]|uniref:Uncharacterized protein n=1 Tax=Alsobacter ponti TaxID=2962936 RepID=A0ABT1LHX1_9HYPH|nr:hypothetical protein [Alsobacter ponti]MCP8941099.1 hypothetical protein [Alsobacter ponti]
MAINWNLITTGPAGLPLPTYGNYGGPLYSDGQILGDPNQHVDYASPPVDQLDALFLRHDQAYDSPDPGVRAAGDLALVSAIAALPDASTTAEQDLYGGGAVVFGLYQMAVVNDRPDLVTPTQDLFYLEHGLGMIGSGLEDANSQTRIEAAHWAFDAVSSAAELGASTTSVAADEGDWIWSQSSAIITNAASHRPFANPGAAEISQAAIPQISTPAEIASDQLSDHLATLAAASWADWPLL